MKYINILSLLLLSVLLLTSCAGPTMVRKCIITTDGRLKPIEPWKPLQLKTGDTINVLSRVRK